MLILEVLALHFVVSYSSIRMPIEEVTTFPIDLPFATKYSTTIRTSFLPNISWNSLQEGQCNTGFRSSYILLSASITRPCQNEMGCVVGPSRRLDRVLTLSAPVRLRDLGMTNVTVGMDNAECSQSTVQLGSGGSVTSAIRHLTSYTAGQVWHR
jgi:hypothetical protein